MIKEKAPQSGQYMVEYGGEKLLIDTSSKVYKKKYNQYIIGMYDYADCMDFLRL